MLWGIDLHSARHQENSRGDLSIHLPLYFDYPCVYFPATIHKITDEYTLLRVDTFEIFLQETSAL